MAYYVQDNNGTWYEFQNPRHAQEFIEQNHLDSRMLDYYEYKKQTSQKKRKLKFKPGFSAIPRPSDLRDIKFKRRY